MKQLLNDFANYLTFVSAGSKKSYLRYVKRVDIENKGKTLQWLKDAAKNTNADPLGELSNEFDNWFNGKPIKPKTKSNWKTGLLTLGKFVFGFNESSINLQSIKKFDLLACQLIAQTAIFCPKHIYEDVKNGKCGSKDNQPKGNAFGSWFNCKYQRAKKGQKRGSIIKDSILGDITLDDNTKANYAIKKAVLEGLKKYGIHNADIGIFKGFEACHIWADTCYNPRYHTSVANLVLIPREIAGLTDHCDAVKELLKYESFKRFGFKPDGENTPNEPKNYDKLTWRTTPTP